MNENGDEKEAKKNKAVDDVRCRRYIATFLVESQLYIQLSTIRINVKK